MNETSDHALDFGREVITAILSVGCTGWTRGAATDWLREQALT